MSSFTTPADLRVLEGYRWELLSDFAFHVGAYPSTDIITVPAGFVTDLASIPRVLWSLLPPHGRYAKAAIIHDWLYATGIGGREYADNVFLEAMEVLGVPKLKRYPMFWAVRLFGQKNYKNAIRDD
jgi:hypothetical protein